MNKTSKVARVYLATLIIFILATVTLRTVALLIDFDPTTGNFGSKAVIKAADICVAVSCLFLSTYAITAEKDKKLIANFSTPATYVPTGAICTALAIFTIYGVKSLIKLNLPLSVLLKPAISARFIFTVCIALAVFAIIHFILTALVTRRGSVSRAAFGIFTVLFFALYASYLYFDTTLALNAPNKIVDQMAFLFTAIFFLYETRISLEREVWHLYIAFGFIAAALNAYSSIPSIIVYFSDGLTVSNNIFENVVSLCAFLFIISRITLATRLKEDKESEIVTLMKEYSLKRDCDTEQANAEVYQKYVELSKSNESSVDSDLKAEDEARAENDGGNGEEDIIEILADESDSEQVDNDNVSTEEEASSRQASEKPGISASMQESSDNDNAEGEDSQDEKFSL